MSTPIGGTSSAQPPTATSGTTNAFSTQLGEQAFLQLLVAELQNQDPTQPMDGNQMIAQLAQLNQTQYAGQQVTAQQETFASSLIGQSVTGTINGQSVTGTCTDFTVNSSNVNLDVGGQAMAVTNVTQVGTPPTTTPSSGGGAQPPASTTPSNGVAA